MELFIILLLILLGIGIYFHLRIDKVEQAVGIIINQQRMEREKCVGGYRQTISINSPTSPKPPSEPPM